MTKKPEASNRWQCPDCGRTFARRTREHSCDVRTVEQHLERASPEIRETFQALITMLKTIGTFQITALKTMLTFSIGSNFGGVTVRKTRLDVGFFLPRLEHHARVVRVEELSPRKIAHHLDLTSPHDVDPQLEAWFRESFEMCRSGNR